MLHRVSDDNSCSLDLGIDVGALGRSRADLRPLDEHLGVAEPGRAPDGATGTATDGGADPDPGRSTASALIAGVVAWAVVLGGILAAGLVAGVWDLANVPARADDVAPSVGVLVLASTAVLVGGPVAVYRERRCRRGVNGGRVAVRTGSAPVPRTTAPEFG